MPISIFILCVRKEWGKIALKNTHTGVTMWIGSQTRTCNMETVLAQESSTKFTYNDQPTKRYQTVWGDVCFDVKHLKLLKTQTLPLTKLNEICLIHSTYDGVPMQPSNFNVLWRNWMPHVH